MDITLQRLRRAHASSPSFTTAMELAGALLRLAPLSQYREAAQAGDAEARELLRYMRANLLGEQFFQEIEDSPDRPRFLEPEPHRVPVGSPYRVKFVNVYCGLHLFASVEVELIDDAIQILDFLSGLYKYHTFHVPPHPAEVLSGNVAGMLQAEKVLSIGVYRDTPCQIRAVIENEPVFDFSDEEAMPPLPARGQRDIRLRAITPEDIDDGDYGRRPGYRQISYEDLPDFAKPDIEGAPTYVMASRVTRGSVQDIDGPAWVDFYQPVAKIYAGYLVNYLLTSPRGWEWGGGITYTYTCRHTQERADVVAGTIPQEGGWAHPRVARRTLPCPLAGIPQFSDRKPNRGRCPECGSDLDVEIHEANQLFLSEGADPGTPEPPAYLNQIIDFLQRLFQDEVYGDIGSVLGGQDLRVYLSEGNYGPLFTA